MTEDNPFSKINPDGKYKYTDFPTLFDDKDDLRRVRLLWQFGVLDKGDDGYVGSSIVREVLDYRRRGDITRRLSQITGKVPSQVFSILRENNLIDQYLVDISKRGKPVYLIDDTERPEERFDELTEKVLEAITSSSKKKSLLVSMEGLRKKSGLSSNIFGQILTAKGLREKYFIRTQEGFGELYHWKETNQEDEFLEELRGIKVFNTSNLTRSLDISLEEFRRCFTPEIRDEYLEPVFTSGDNVYYQYKEGKSADDLARIIEVEKLNVQIQAGATKQSRKVQRLMFIKSRYQGDIAYQAKIELFLQLYNHVSNIKREGMENEMLDQMVSILYDHIPGERSRTIIDGLKERYKGLEVKVGSETEDNLADEKDFDDTYDLITEDGIIPLPKMCAVLGLNPLEVLSLMKNKTFPRGLVRAVGGDERNPHYALNEGISIEDLTQHLLTESEAEDTQKVVGRSSEYSSSKRRVMFLKVRYPYDIRYHAKVDFLLQGQTPALLSNGIHRMNCVDNLMLDQVVRILHANLSGGVSEKVSKWMKDYYGLFPLGAEAAYETKLYFSGEMSSESLSKEKRTKSRTRTAVSPKRKSRKKVPVEKEAETSKSKPSEEPPKKLTGKALWDSLGDDDDYDEELDSGYNPLDE
ncbi:MAG: hypothetical protein ABIH82_04210 [Candidatus Woesearchaeota archaeon]